ncbi:MAG: hypothetical protein ABI857_10010, partial [Acidobacteriota bacterium]
MPEEQNELREESEGSPPEEKDEGVAEKRRRRYFTRRNAVLTTAFAAILVVLVFVLSVAFYRYGVFDNYVRTQFVAKMADIGVVFEADVFRVRAQPRELLLAR